MARDMTPNGGGRPPDQPSHVSIAITFVPADRGRRLREVCARLARAPRSLCVVVAVASAALVAAALLHGSRTNIVVGSASANERAATRAVAAAFGYPPRCVSIAIPAADPNYASAHVERRGGCANYHGYVNASFHRVDGVWRLILDEGQLFVPNGLLKPAGAGTTGTEVISAYPLGCLRVAIALHDPRFSRADIDRRLACVRHRR